MQRRWSIAALVAVVSLVLAACGGLNKNNNSSGSASGGSSSKPTVRLGVVDFTEQAILGQIYGRRSRRPATR